VGLQLIGAVMDEALLLQIAQAFELARPLLHPPLA
jgi:Asp-tRNA(Asn)/Glu-tRNA(Gln) amidotransferase A subunit family amidase